jgi:hypothetical protein
MKKVNELKKNNENVLARMEHALARQGWHVEYIVVRNIYDNWNNLNNVNITDKIQFNPFLSSSVTSFLEHIPYIPVM